MRSFLFKFVCRVLSRGQGSAKKNEGAQGAEEKGQ